MSSTISNNLLQQRRVTNYNNSIEQVQQRQPHRHRRRPLAVCWPGSLEQPMSLDQRRPGWRPWRPAHGDRAPDPVTVLRLRHPGRTHDHFGFAFGDVTTRPRHVLQPRGHSRVSGSSGQTRCSGRRWRAAQPRSVRRGTDPAYCSV